MNILLSPIGGRAMHGIIEYFKERGHRIIGIDSNPEAAGRHFVDRFYVMPRLNDPRYPGTLEDIRREEDVELFISWLDPEILLWQPDLMRFCDKLECAKMLNENGFLVPGTFTPAFGDFPPDFPCILKPRISTGSRDVIKIDDEVAWEFHTMRMAQKGKFVAQEFLFGPEFTVDFFADRGELVNGVVRQRHEHQGVTLRGEVVSAPSILEIVDRLVCRFVIDGLNNAQFIASGGQNYLIDFNPRPSGTIMLSVCAGVDMLHNLIERQEGKPLTRYGEPRPLKMVRYLTDLYHE